MRLVKGYSMRLVLSVLVAGLWACNDMATEGTAHVLSAFDAQSGDKLCDVVVGGKAIILRGSNAAPAGVVIGGSVAIALAEKGSGKWKMGTEELGTYKIYQADHTDYKITLKWTEGGSMAVLNRIEHFGVIDNSDASELYTYQAGHNDKEGDPPSCS